MARPVVKVFHLSVVLVCLAWVADARLPAAEFELRNVHAKSFEGDRVFYVVPYSGGELASCDVAPGSKVNYPLGSDILIIKTRVLGRCTLAPLPKNWVAPKFD
jgi:hypothetical protein